MTGMPFCSKTFQSVHIRHTSKPRAMIHCIDCCNIQLNMSSAHEHIALLYHPVYHMMFACTLLLILLESSQLAQTICFLIIRRITTQITVYLESLHQL